MDAAMHPDTGAAPATVDALGEHAIIARICERMGPAPDWLLVDVGDDAAVYEPARNLAEVVTTDAIVDGVHVNRALVSAQEIGHRALAVNLSDLAAMGAAPRLATLSLALPADLPVTDLDDLVSGVLALAERTRTRLVGGNVTRIAGPLVVDVVAIGSVHRRRVLTRRGARPGDYIFVSGTLGDARAGLARLIQAPTIRPDQASYPVARYLRPEPRLRLGQLLGRRRAATAALDLSDGLADGLSRLAECSGVGLEVEADALPIHPETAAAAAEAGRDAVREALVGGDDYELLFTVSPKRLRAVTGVARLVGELNLTRIGRVTRTPGTWLMHADGRREPVPPGYEHFTL